jgi:hypothetical protein
MRLQVIVSKRQQAVVSKRRLAVVVDVETLVGVSETSGREGLRAAEDH